MNTKLRQAGFTAIVFALVTISASVGHAAQRASRLGLLIPESGPAEGQTLKGLKDRLKELGYTEGDNLVIELRDMKGDRSGLTADANDLVQKKVDVIFTTGTRATQAAKAATKEIPIVFRHPADPVLLGFVKNLKRPEANVTGVAAFALEMNSKRVEISKMLVPNLRRIHVFYDSNNRYSPENLIEVEKFAPKFKVEVVDHPVKTVGELAKSLEKLQVRDGDAIYQISDDLVESQADVIFDTAKKLKLPTIFDDESWANKGSLASYGPNYAQMGRQAAEMIAKLLNGTKPKDLPVERANKFDLVINLRTAKAIGVSIAPDVLTRADKVIR
jgi:putative tryptophan/tyrosine transport system substrate-binding protein